MRKVCRNQCLRRDTEQQKGKPMWVWRLLLAEMKKEAAKSIWERKASGGLKQSARQRKREALILMLGGGQKTWFTWGAERGWKDKEE